jgi:hypothetical protein
LLWSSGSPPAEERSVRDDLSPIPGNNHNRLLMRASLAFVVSVCLTDVEYSIACRERSLFEAEKRLEQVYLDAYNTKRAGGSLQIWFPLAMEESEQLSFLRELEDRAIEGFFRKLQQDGEYSAAPTTSFANTPGELQDNAQQRNRRIEKWRQEASSEARKGTNWLHDWASRTHFYRSRSTLDELAHIGEGDRSEKLAARRTKRRSVSCIIDSRPSADRARGSFATDPIPIVADQSAGGRTLRLQLRRIERLARGHEQAVAFGNAKSEVGALLRQCALPGQRCPPRRARRCRPISSVASRISSALLAWSIVPSRLLCRRR